MATTALGIMQASDGAGLDPLTHRRIIMSRWANTGVITGLSVTGRTDLRYNVSAGCAVVSRSDSDGYAEAYFEGGQTDAVSAGDASNPRVDIIWIKANDLQQGDADNRVHIGVTQGTPSSNPVAPAAPAGCLVLMQMRMPAGATSTNSAVKNSSITFALPYGASFGILDRVGENIDGTVDFNSKSEFLSQSVYLPTDRNIQMHAYLCVSSPGKRGEVGVAAVQFYVDGEIYTTRKVEYTENWVTYEPTANIQLEAGTHRLGIAMYNEQGIGFEAHYSHNDPDDRGNFYVGRVLVIKDEGVAQ